jgi:hypothetical protein
MRLWVFVKGDFRSCEIEEAAVYTSHGYFQGLPTAEAINNFSVANDHGPGVFRFGVIYFDHAAIKVLL